MLVIRNFFSIVRRYKAAFVLNVAGLSVAMTVAALIVMQLRYDLTFDPDLSEKDNICLAALDCTDAGLGIVAVVPRPLEEVVAKNPQVEAVCLVDPIYQSVFVNRQGESGENTAFREQMASVSKGFADVLGIDFVERMPAPLAAPGSVLIPESLARKVAGDSSALGIVLEVKGLGKSYTVTGVYRNFAANSSFRNAIYDVLDDNVDNNWGSFNYNMLARFRPGADTEPVASLILEEIMKSDDYFAKRNIGGVLFTDLKSLHFSEPAIFDSFPKTEPSRLLIFLAVAVMVLLIACINMMNFNTALSPMRVRSMNTMKVLGSSRLKLCTGIIGESLSVAVIAWILSVMSVLALKNTAVAGLIDPEISLHGQIPVFVITLGTAVLACILSGIYPALYITSFPPALALKGNFALSPKGRRIRSFLVGFQFFVSFALASCIGIIFLQNRHLRDADLGFDKDRIMTVRTDGLFSDSDYEFFRNSVENIPGVEKVSYASYILSSSDDIMTWGVEMKGEQFSMNIVVVWDGFMETIGADITEGRDFRKGDENCWILNDCARRTFGVSMEDRITDRGGEIIGFTEDINAASLRKSISPMAFVYGPGYEESDSGNDDVAYIRIEAGADQAQVEKDVQSVLQEIEKDYPFELLTSDGLFMKTYSAERKVTLMIASFCLIAILISMIGVFCLVMFDSESRRKEIAVRKVMGSDTAGIIRNFIRSYMIILGISFILAVPVTVYFGGNWLDGFADRIAFPGWIFLPVLAVFSVLTVLTVAWQSWKAASENPVRNLKSE